MSTTPTTHVQRLSAETLYADELALLAQEDGDLPRPAGWRLTPRSVLRFVQGDEQRDGQKDGQGNGQKDGQEGPIRPKFVGSRAMLERCIVALATNRGLMLIGEPGTAKSYLSELLAAAISGDSTLIIQGSAGTTEDNIKYGWNYALLLAEGPTDRSLVPAPVYRGMQEGKLVRFEELTRCPLEIQDTMLSILSERVLPVPERNDEGRTLYAQGGFNVIGTANTRDRGVNEMSAALKRRFNFETIPPISNLRQELDLVQRETDRLLARANIPHTLPPQLTEVLVTTFHELRSGRTAEGKALETLSTVMSTAEAVSVGFAAAIHAYYYEGGTATPEHIVNSLVGSALKDTPEDLPKLRHYFSQVVHSRKSPLWQAYYEARTALG